jgi:hypothetical protein
MFYFPGAGITAGARFLLGALTLVVRETKIIVEFNTL